MPKKKRKAKQKTETQIPPSSSNVLQITAEELQNIITNALLQAEEQRKQIEEDKQEQEKQKWREEIGYKDYSKSKSIFAGFLRGFNTLLCGLKLLFMPSKKIKGHKAISSSLSVELSNNFMMIGLIYLILSLIVAAGTIALLVFNLIPWYIGLLLFILAIFFFLYALKNRLAYASPELRSKKALIENFIDGVNEVSDIMIEWREYVAAQKEKQLIDIISQENLKPDETRKFIDNSFRDGQIKTTGTDIDKIMPPISRFGGGDRTKKKQSIIEKLKAFLRNTPTSG